MTEKTTKDSSGKLSEAGGKKPYKTPAFRSERVFEVSALACGKVHTTQQPCRGNRKTS
ncbi:MAG TPA: hypothetical protein VGI46_02485 [Candidatus Acidoferrum sp.]|jgi:hypothetical protein